jgi:hypothetical protein
MDNLRGPEGDIREVLVKIESKGGSTWYIIESTEGHETDSSPVEHNDKIVYMHPEVKGIIEPGEELDTRKHTFIPGERVKEIVVIKSNTQAKSFLSKEW